MSHAAYVFLMDVSELGEDFTRNDIERLFASEYGETSYCDENNWWTAMSFILKDGTHVPMAPEGDWRGRDSLQADIEEMPQSERWDYAMNFAWQVVGIDMEILGAKMYSFGGNDEARLSSASYDEIVQAIADEVPAKIIELVQPLVGVTPTSWRDRPEGEPRQADRSMDLYRAKRLIKQLDAFWNSIEWGSGAPWAEPMTPYESYRAMRLADADPASDNVGILIVDIHT